MASKTYRDTCKLVGGFLSYPIETELGRFWQTVQIDTPAWVEWLEAADTKRFSYEGKFTVRKERRTKGTRAGSAGLYWYAYKKIEGAVKRRYLGASSKVTLAALEAASNYFAEMEKHLPRHLRTM